MRLIELLEDFDEGYYLATRLMNKDKLEKEEFEILDRQPQKLGAILYIMLHPITSYRNTYTNN